MQNKKMKMEKGRRGEKGGGRHRLQIEWDMENIL